MEKQAYIIASCNSGQRGIETGLVYGTKEQVKSCLAAMSLKDQDLDPDNYLYGAETESDIEGLYGNTFRAASYYETYHIEYAAAPAGITKEL